VIGTVDWFKRWIAPLAVVALGVGSLAGAIWYRAAVPVVFMPGTERVVTQTFTPQPIVNTVTKTAAAPAPSVETVERTAQAAAETVTRTIEVPATQKQRETKTETVTETATETERVLQVVDNDKGKSGERGN
jgi:hypothetical protein